MHLKGLVLLNILAQVKYFLLAQVELKQQILDHTAVEAKTGACLFLVEELDKHVSPLILHNLQFARIYHRPERLDFDLSDSLVLDEVLGRLLHDSSESHLLPIGQHSVKDLAVLLISLLVQDALHLGHLVRILCQLPQFTVSKAQL